MHAWVLGASLCFPDFHPAMGIGRESQVKEMRVCKTVGLVGQIMLTL